MCPCVIFSIVHSREGEGQISGEEEDRPQSVSVPTGLVSDLSSPFLNEFICLVDFQEHIRKTQ